MFVASRAGSHKYIFCGNRYRLVPSFNTTTRIIVVTNVIFHSFHPSFQGHIRMLQKLAAMFHSPMRNKVSKSLPYDIIQNMHVSMAERLGRAVYVEYRSK